MVDRCHSQRQSDFRDGRGFSCGSVHIGETLTIGTNVILTTLQQIFHIRRHDKRHRTVASYPRRYVLNPTPEYLAESPPPVWHYPKKYTGGLVLGNLLAAIMMRNELFGRLLYLIVNTCFAKVRD